MNQLHIRKATPTDAKNIIDYLNHIGGESDNLLFGQDGFSWMTVEKEAELIKTTNSTNQNVLLLGLIGDEIVSISNIQGFPRERTSHRCTLAISVKRHYWNQGVGTAMMKSLLSFAKETAGYSVVELQVKADNTYAIQLYESFGFKKIGRYEKFFKINNIYYDALLMNLYFE